MYKRQLFLLGAVQGLAAIGAAFAVAALVVAIAQGDPWEPPLTAMAAAFAVRALAAGAAESVSYTHLDVYKRQATN